jgi:Calcineurin-like phosphoesterase
MPSTSAVTLSARISRPAADRIVAIGDLHGDMEATRKVLRLAGAIDANDAWVGGKLVVVQTGDEIDRGDGDRKIIDLMERLKVDAKATGGEVIALSGNHELMNAQFDFRYVTLGGFAAFSDVTPKNADITARISDIDANAKGRAAAFAPGGPYAAILAERPIVMKVGDNVFVHGGILPKHISYGLDKMDREVADWLLGKEGLPSVAIADDGPVWTRSYSAAPGKEECALLDRALGSLGAKRMIVGHTVQRDGVTSACEGKVWRVDVGLSHYFGGPVQALEIKGDTMTVLKEPG